MFLRPTEEELENFEPEWQILSVPGLKLDPRECGTRQHNGAIVSFKHKMILIAGTGYTGETKKGYSLYSTTFYRMKKCIEYALQC